MPFDPCLILLAITGGFAAWLVWYGRYLKAVNAFRERLLASSPIYVTSYMECRCIMTTLGGKTRRWRRCMLMVDAEGIHLYPNVRDEKQAIHLPASGLRWFGRPVKYHDGRNELWLHVEEGDTWRLVKIKTWRYAMHDIVRAIKQIVPPELVTAYRRHRPYVHAGPVKAQPAEQDIYGAWSLDAPVSLYVMPLYVVLLQGSAVVRTLPLDRIEQMAALRRLDKPDADGLVSLTVQGERSPGETLPGEKLAFAISDYERIAAAISEAAKRSLEQPVRQKQKKKDASEADDEWDE